MQVKLGTVPLRFHGRRSGDARGWVVQVYLVREGEWEEVLLEFCHVGDPPGTGYPSTGAAPALYAFKLSPSSARALAALLAAAPDAPPSPEQTP